MITREDFKIYSLGKYFDMYPTGVMKDARLFVEAALVAWDFIAIANARANEQVKMHAPRLVVDNTKKDDKHV